MRADQMTDAGSSVSRSFAVDTTFVLFFLAMDLGQSFAGITMDGMLSALTLGVLLVAPYFLPSYGAKPAFGSWVLGRVIIAAFAVSIGLAFKQALGIVLPETFRFLPMTMLIATAMVSCYVQFYGLMRFRWAK
jgi:hypothetical protein